VAICQSVVRHFVTLVPTGNAVGKSFCLAGLILWWLYTRPGSLVVATAPSQTLLGSVLFKELRRAMAKAVVPLPGRLSDSPRAAPQTLEIDSVGWGCLGIATRGVERLSGQHNPDLLVVVDEASGIEEAIWEALDSQNPSKAVYCGNPLRPNGRFHDLSLRAAREWTDPQIPDRERVHEIRIPTTESPHIGLDRSPCGLADRRFLANARRQYGEGSLWWRTHILAEFPEVGAEAVFPLAWLDRAASTPRPAPPAVLAPWSGKRRMAIDLGEGCGRDSSVVLVRDDLGVLDVHVSNRRNLEETAWTAAHLAGKHQIVPECIVFDGAGMLGKAFVAKLPHVGIVGAWPYFGGRPSRAKGLANARTECAFRLRQRLDPEQNEHAFSIPPRDWWPRLRQELATLTYEIAGDSRTRLMSKEDHCLALGRSPDVADALLMSFAFLN
jgi:phage terminase large subunit